MLQGVVLAAAGALAGADDAVEGEVELGAERHAQEVGRGEDAQPGKDDARRAVAALELFEDGQHPPGEGRVFGDLVRAYYAGEELEDYHCG